MSELKTLKICMEPQKFKDLGELISSADKFYVLILHLCMWLSLLVQKTYVIFGPTDDNALIPKNENVVAIKKLMISAN